MFVLFPSNVFRPTEVDSDFADEAYAARACGFDVAYFNLESLSKADVVAAVRHIPQQTTPQIAIHRSWMMPDTHYELLYRALQNRGINLIIDPPAYAQAHYLPNSYSILEGETPFTRWIENADLDLLWEMYVQDFQQHDAVIKDFVKSAKHLWNEACFIPCNTSKQQLEKIVKAFLADRGNLFEKGIVLRRFMNLRTDGRDMRGRPRVNEMRLFFYRHKVLISPRPGFELPASYMSRILQIAARFQSPFFSMDIAETEQVDYVIIEVGDGGVSGLPVSLLPEDFFAAIKGAGS